MTMDTHSNGFSNPVDGFNFAEEIFLPNFGQYEDFPNNFQTKEYPLDLSFMESPLKPLGFNPNFITSTTSGSSELDSSDDSDDVLKFINSILMEENIEEKPSMFHDPLSIQAAEKSLYDIIGEKYPSSPNEPPLYSNYSIDSPDDYLLGNFSEQSSFSNTSASNNSEDSQWVIDPGTFKQNLPLEPSYSGSVKNLSDNGNGFMDFSINKNMVPSIFTDSESILQFQRGMEEASKFLPKNNQLLINMDSYKFSPHIKNTPSKVKVQVDDENKETSPNRGKRSHNKIDTFGEERSSKQSAVFEEEDELSEFFDTVLLCTDAKCGNEEELKIEQIVSPQEGKNRAKKQGNKNKVVDLRTLLINCAQSVAADDRRTANEQLNQIRQHCSPFGDASQRVANIFANGLEARLAGTGSQKYAALASKRISSTEKLKAYQLYLSCCPFKKLAMSFSNKLIYDLATNSSKKKLHIIDFGIGYGFQWPILIKYLKSLPNGPPELRVTGIEFPLPGFRPAEMVEETGRRLAKYCERFNVKFKYHPIAQKWENIRLEDLNLPRNEDIAVNCLFRFKNLLDETVAVDSPRDAVLSLIRKINPDIFISHTTNGSFSAPFFVTRFREALFHYSSYFDMFDTTILSRENNQRINFEQEFYGREVMNIIACEGVERVERPETYKQWQVRNIRAGFKIQPLENDVLNILKGKIVGYHKDFVIDEDGKWLLQGWKGRIMCASSSWVPA